MKSGGVSSIVGGEANELSSKDGGEKKGSHIVPGKDYSVAKVATIDVDMKGGNFAVNSGDITKDKANTKDNRVVTDMIPKGGKDGRNKKKESKDVPEVHDRDSSLP